MLIVVSLIFFFFMVYAGLILFYWAAWRKIPPYTFRHRATDRVSVIIPARNESENIGPLLQSLEAQTYPSSLFEVIIVDDHSEDDTPALLQSYRGPLPLRVIKLADYLNGETVMAHKKRAIETGIQLATGDLIITTDADCRFHRDWISYLADFHQTHQAKFIAAPVRFTESPSLLSIFQCLDFISLQGITGASVFRRFHNMCNGANLAYEKKAFLEAGGFEGIDQIPSGDDMLLMHKIAVRYPGEVFYFKDESVIVETAPARSWKAFFQQRIRWASKATHYEDKRIFWVLVLVYFFNVSFAVMLLASFFNPDWLFAITGFWVLKTIVEWPLVSAVARFFGQSHLMKYFPLLQPIHILYTIIAGWLGKFGSFEWKGRKINTTQTNDH